MRTRLMQLGSLVAALAVTSIASGVALAQSSGDGAAKFTRTGAGGGSVSRTITDVVPNGPGVGPFGVVHVTSTTISFTVDPGDNADAIGTEFRNEINNNGALQALGYSSKFSTPGSVTTQSRPKLTRQVGGYTVVDGQTGPITFTVDPYTVQDAPGLSPVGLAFLVGALPALAFWHHRRRKSV